MSGEYWDDLPPVLDEVTISRAPYEALMAAAKALATLRARGYLGPGAARDMADKRLAALCAAGIDLEDKP
jgi:hypothetical protein